MEWTILFCFYSFVASSLFALLNIYSCNVKTQATIINKRHYEFDTCFVKLSYLDIYTTNLLVDNCFVNTITIYYNYFNPQSTCEVQNGSLPAGFIFLALSILYLTISVTAFTQKKPIPKPIAIDEHIVPSYNVLLGASEHGKISALVVNP